MKYNYVLFDLDGTLLPYDADLFVKSYMKKLAEKMAAYAYDPKELIGTVWAGCEAMVKNDGSVYNEQRFSDIFRAVYHDRWDKDREIFAEFYRNEFNEVKEVCGCTENAKIVRELRCKGVRVILATSPLFPKEATYARIAWAGLVPEDFDYITSYENCKFSKPNPLYYSEICGKLGIDPGKAVMVGNDADEDIPAEVCGMDVFILTDCLLNRSGKDISGYPQGGFTKLREFLGI